MLYEIFRVFGVLTGYPLLWLFFKPKIFYQGKKNKKWKKGGKLIISNHFSIIDYILVCFMVFPRKLTAVASEMPFKSGIVRFGMKFFGTIQANREIKDMSFIEKSAEVISNGKLVQIFPEAKNTPDGKMHEFKPSYIRIAEMAGCKILPIITDGNYGLFKRTSVIIGEEIDLTEILGWNDEFDLTKEQVNKANEIIYKKSLELRDRLEQLKNKRK